MIEFTSIIPLSCKKTPLSLDWADKNFELTYERNGFITYLIDDTKDCRLSRLMNEDGSDYWKLTICFATFNVNYTEEVVFLLRTFQVNVKRKEILDE